MNPAAKLVNGLLNHSIIMCEILMQLKPQRRITRTIVGCTRDGVVSYLRTLIESRNRVSVCYCAKCNHDSLEDCLKHVCQCCALEDGYYVLTGEKVWYPVMPIHIDSAISSYIHKLASVCWLLRVEQQHNMDDEADSIPQKTGVKMFMSRSLEYCLKKLAFENYLSLNDRTLEKSHYEGIKFAWINVIF